MMSGRILYEKDEAQRQLVETQIGQAACFRDNWYNPNAPHVGVEADLCRGILEQVLRSVFATRGSEGLRPLVRFTASNWGEVSFGDDIEAALVCDIMDPADPHGVMLMSACYSIYDGWQRGLDRDHNPVDVSGTMVVPM